MTCARPRAGQPTGLEGEGEIVALLDENADHDSAVEVVGTVIDTLEAYRI